VPNRSGDTQSLIAAVAAGLEAAGYAALLTPGRKSWASLRPALEAYATYHGLSADAPLETFAKSIAAPRCHRPDVDYLPDGTPMGTPSQPEASTIERFLAGDLPDPGDSIQAQAGTIQATKSYQLTKIPDAGDRLTRSVAELAAHSDSVWASICGLRLRIVPSSQPANIRVTDRYLGPGVLGMATVGRPGGIASASLQQWLNPSFAWTDQLLWTTIWHEDGHNLGSGHINGANMMAPVNNLRTEPGQGDRRFAVQHYGQPVAGPAPQPPGPQPPIPGPGPDPLPAGEGTVTLVSPDGRVILVKGVWVETRPGGR
jgi:hypothetical protein